MLRQQGQSEPKSWNWWLAAGAGSGAIVGGILIALVVTPQGGWIGAGIGAFLGGLFAGILQKRTHQRW